MARKRLEVEILGDAASAEAALGGLGASLDALNDKRIEIKGEDADLRRKIVEDKELIASLGTAEGKAKLGLDDEGAKAKVVELKAEIDSIGMKRAKLSVDDAQARAEIASIKADMDLIHDKDVKVNVDKDKSAASSLTDLGKKFDDTASKIPTMVAAAGLLGPAIIPAAAAAAAGIGALSVPLTAAAVGFGSLGIIASPILDSLKKDMTTVTPLFEKWKEAQPGPQQVAAWNNVEAAIAKLPPGERQVVQGITDLKAQLVGLSSEIRPQLLGAFSTWLGDAHKLLPQLVAPAKEAALALNDLGTSVSKGLDSPAWHHFMDVITPQIRPAIDSIGRSFGNLVKGLGGVIEAFAPFAGAVESGMERVTRAFANWGQGLGASGGFQKFMDYVRQNGPQLKTTLEDLGRAGVDLVKAFGQFGGVNLKILDDLAKAISAIASAPGGAVVLEILALSAAFGKLAGVAKLGTVISDLIGLGGALRVAGSAAAGMVGTFLPGVASALAGLGGVVTSALGAAFSIPGAVVAGVIAEAGIVALAFSDSLRKSLISSLPKGIQDGINHAAGAVKNAISVIFPPVAAIRAILDSHFRTAIADFFTQTIPNAISTAAGAVGRAVERYGQAIGNAFSHFGSLLASGVGIVARFFQALPGQIVGFLSRLPGDLLNLAGRAGSALYNGLIQHIPAILGFMAGLPIRIVGFLVTLPIRLAQLGIEAIGALANGLISAAPVVWGFVSSIPGRVIGLLASLGSQLLSFGTQAIQSMASGIASGFNAVASFVGSIPGRVIGLLSSLGGDLLNLGSQALSSMASGVSSGFDAVASFVSSIPGKIVSALGDLGGLLVQAGQAVVEGLAKGIEGAIGGVLSSAVGHVKSVISDIGSFLGIGSPSRLTTYWGEMLGQGLAVGLHLAIPNVDKAALAAVGAALGPFSTPSTGGFSAGPSSYSGLSGRAVTIHAGAIQVNLNGDAGSNPTATGSAIGKEVMRSLARELRST